MTEYPVEVLDEDADDGTMPENVAKLAENIVGHRIVSAHRGLIQDTYWGASHGVTLTLDDGRKVKVADTSDCCAGTWLEDVVLNLDKIDHVILGVGTTDQYQTWHIYADLGDVMTMKVGWSCGNPFYYGYGFDITVEEA